MNTTIYDASHKLDDSQKERIANFIFTHLEEYGDPKSAVKKAIDYAVEDRPSLGGHVFIMEEADEIIGAVVINKTGMDEYIPENILVYIATHKDYRRKGFGKKLMEFAIDNCEGSIALHCEKDNPAKMLYEKLGFTNKYLEMRLEK